MNLKEKLEEQIAINESVETDAAKYFWALNEVGYKPNFQDVIMVVGTAKSKGIPVDLMVGLVAGESSWRNDVVHHNGGSSDYGLFQLNSLWHNQYRNSIINHIKTGIDHYKWCLRAEKNSPDKALARYNTGGSGTAAGRQYASYINGKKREIDSKARKYKQPSARGSIVSRGRPSASRGSISSRRS